MLGEKAFRDMLANTSNTSSAVVSLHLNWRGEPTLNRSLNKLLYAVWEIQPTWPVEWHTNGTMLTPERAEELVAAHPRQTIMVSLDGGNQTSFERNRGAGSWRKALSGTQSLLAARRQFPEVTVGIYQLELGVADKDYDPEFKAVIEAADKHIRSAPVGLNGEPVDRADINKGARRGPCFWMGNALAITPKGEAYSCLLPAGTRVGSLLTEHLDTIVKRARKMREIASTVGRARLPGCNTCLKCEGNAH